MNPARYEAWSEEARVAYAAGIVDGEGAIGLKHAPRGGNGYSLQVQIGQNSKGYEMLEFLQYFFGGGITSPRNVVGNRKPLRHCYWSGNRLAIAFLKRIRPFLIIKAGLADLAFDFSEFHRSRESWVWTIEDRSKGQVFFDEFTRMNRKGKQSTEGHDQASGRPSTLAEPAPSA